MFKKNSKVFTFALVICSFLVLYFFRYQLSYILLTSPPVTVIFDNEFGKLSLLDEKEQLIDFWSLKFSFKAGVLADDIGFSEYRDENTLVFMGAADCATTIIDDVDPNQVFFLKTQQNRRESIYIYNNEAFHYSCGFIKKIEDADINSLEEFGRYAKDKSRVYYKGEQILGADPGTFITGYFKEFDSSGIYADAQDINHFYNDGKIILTK